MYKVFRLSCSIKIFHKQLYLAILHKQNYKKKVPTKVISIKGIFVNEMTEIPKSN